MISLFGDFSHSRLYQGKHWENFIVVPLHTPQFFYIIFLAFLNLLDSNKRHSLLFQYWNTLFLKQNNMLLHIFLGQTVIWHTNMKRPMFACWRLKEAWLECIKLQVSHSLNMNYFTSDGSDFCISLVYIAKYLNVLIIWKSNFVSHHNGPGIKHESHKKKFIFSVFSDTYFVLSLLFLPLKGPNKHTFWTNYRSTYSSCWSPLRFESL